MDGIGRLGARGLDEAEDLAGRLVVPVSAVVDAILLLDLEVAGVGGGDGFAGQARDVSWVSR